jgi:endonuclease YncB( thermonuclease family)
MAVIVLGASLQPLAATAAPSAEGAVARVVDGDTIVASVSGVEERVRFLNIDTPETGTCMADKATSFTSRQLPAGAPIDLRYDRDLRDPYERLLALVKPQGGEWVSVSLAERGLGFPVSIAPNSTYYGRVVSAADRAKRTGAGMFSPKRSCTPVSRARRANAMVTQTQGAPVRSKAQYDAANRKLDQALALLAMASASRYGVSSTYFLRYTKSLRVPVQRRIRSVRAAKTRQWNIVRNQQQNQQNNSDDNHTPSNSNDGWWPPGVPLSYTGPRCYEPGGVVWYPC